MNNWILFDDFSLLLMLLIIKGQSDNWNPKTKFKKIIFIDCDLNSFVVRTESKHIYWSIYLDFLYGNICFSIFIKIIIFQTGEGTMQIVYKKVAVVEKFFDIIYSVHVESGGDTQLRGRAGKHCGQKRTFRVVSIHISSCF